MPGQPCVVVVEDTDAVCAELLGLLEADRMNTVAVPTLQRARVAIERVKPDVVIIGLDIARGAGEALLDELARARVGGPGVVLVSSDAKKLAIVGAAYAVPVLSRPFDSNVVAATVRVAAEQRLQPRRQRRAVS